MWPFKPKSSKQSLDLSASLQSADIPAPITYQQAITPPNYNNGNELSDYSKDEVLKYVQLSPVLSRCVSIIRSQAGDVEFLTTKKQGGVVKDGFTPQQVFDAIYSPLLYNSKNEMLQELFWLQMFQGGCYIIINNTNALSGVYFEICPIDKAEIVFDNDKKIVIGIKITKNNNENFIPFLNHYTDWQTKKDKIFAIRYAPLSYDARNGFLNSPIFSAILAAKLQIMQYHRAGVILDKNPNASSLYSIVPSEFVSRETAEALRNALIESVKDAKKEGKPIVAFGKVEVTSLSSLDSDLFSVKLMQQAEKNIAIAMGVPPNMLGIGSATYENMAGDRINFLENCVYANYAQPFLSAICGALLPPAQYLKIDKSTLNMGIKS